MKMSIIVSMALTMGMGIMGYMYLKKHPEVVNKMMSMKKDVDDCICNMMDS